MTTQMRRSRPNSYSDPYELRTTKYHRVNDTKWNSPGCISLSLILTAYVHGQTSFYNINDVIRVRLWGGTSYSLGSIGLVGGGWASSVPVPGGGGGVRLSLPNGSPASASARVPARLGHFPLCAAALFLLLSHSRLPATVGRFHGRAGVLSAWRCGANGGGSRRESRN